METSTCARISSSILFSSLALLAVGTSRAEAESQNNSPRWPGARKQGICNGNRERKTAPARNNPAALPIFSRASAFSGKIKVGAQNEVAGDGLP